MKGRRVPPAFVVLPVRADDPSQEADGRYFREHAGVREYTRDALPGELPEALPAGTKVLVRRIGAFGRARAFRTPAAEVN